MTADPSRSGAKLPPPVLVEDRAGMDRLLGDLASQSEIAVDTEADSFFHYREKVCLLQVTVEDRDYLVDPLADVDLARLGSVLADESKVKVFHDGEYDVLILKRDYGFEFANLFDTRVAASALGVESPGLASVLREAFGVELDKSLQRSNWSQRPLKPEQIDYARLDTRYLIPLMHDFRAELAERERTMIVEGECRRLAALEPAERSFNPDEFIRLRGARDLSGAEQQCLRELFVERERLAEARDLPPFKVLNNQLLVALAQARPTDERSLERVQGLSPRIQRRYGRDILAALERARSKGALRRPPQLPSRDGTGVLDDYELELHERLRVWRKECAEERGIDSSLILNRHVLVRIASAKPRSLAELEALDGLLEWQLEAFGHELAELVGAFRADLEAGRIQPPRRRGRRAD